jgi:acyl-CoA synthetase (AMP-forming)/AMP-acid ligase II
MSPAQADTGPGSPDPVHRLTLPGVLSEHRRSRPEALSVVCGRVRLTYPELDDRTDRLARAFVDAGVGRGDRVVWLGQNCHRLIEAWLAASKIGAVVVPANWRQSAGEMVTLLDDARPVVVIWQQEEIGATVEEARSRWGGVARWLSHDAVGDPDGYEGFVAAAGDAAIGDASDSDAVGSAPVHESISPADPVLQLYTGAFGGTPNGALLSHRSILAQAVMVAMVQWVTGETVYLNSGPMFHMATLMTTFATFQMGGTNVLTRRVEADELCRVIEAERCNYGFVMGPTAEEIMVVNADGRYDLSSFRTFGGSPAWNAMVEVDDSPWGLHPAGYGQTEVTGMLTFNALGIGTEGTSGRPSPWVEVRIVDPDGADVPTGETGEIVARGPIITNGYHDRPRLNAERFRGGWWHTGDLGRRHPDGSLTFVAPLTRIVKSAAENIYPAEVEGCLAQHPAVREAAIIGVPDKRWTQRVLAVVVLQPGAEVTAEELIEHCRAHIASYKKPSLVEFTAKLPRKGWAVDYEELDRRYGGGGYPGSA